MTGDFNESAKPLENLAKRWRLNVSQSATRKDRKLDLVVSDMVIKKERTCNFATSDHRALLVELETKHELHLKRRYIPKRGLILKDLKLGKLHMREADMFGQPFSRMLR